MDSKFDVLKHHRPPQYHLQTASDFFQSVLEKYRGNQQIHEVKIEHKSSPNFSKTVEKSN